MTTNVIVTIESSPFPAWPWVLRAADGTVVKRFRSHEAMTGWLRRHQAEFLTSPN